jgi:thioredoxin 1
MSSDDELDSIREQKRAELEAQLDGDEGEDAATAADKPVEPVHVDGPDHLAEIVSTYDVVLVDFYADWCGPCKMLEPTVEALARESEAVVAKVDVDANQQLAGQYGVRGVPTLVLFSGGEVAEQLVGVQDRSTLDSLVADHAA